MTGDVNQDYLESIEQLRSDGAKEKRKATANDLVSTEITYSV